MKRVSNLLLGLLVGSLPALALAQSSSTTPTTTAAASTGTIQVQLYQLDGHTYNERQVVPINKEQCDKDVSIVFKLHMLNKAALTAKYLQLWQGPSCNQSTQRDGQTPNSDCRKVEVPESWTITYGTDMKDYEMTVGGLCTDIATGTKREGTLPFYFLPVANTTDVTDVAVFGLYNIQIDQTPPNAPGNVTVGSGQTSIPIDWVPSDAAVHSNFLIWDIDPIDTEGGEVTDDAGNTTNAACTSEFLRAGDDVDFEAYRQHGGIRWIEVPGGVNHTTISENELGVNRAALAMASTDLATNTSKLSNVDCVTVVPTKGFWDDYKANGGAAEEGCACSAPGARGSQPSIGSALAPIALVVLARTVRRRKQRRGAA